MQICLQVRETDIAYFLGIFPSYPSIYQCIPFYFIFHFKNNTSKSWKGDHTQERIHRNFAICQESVWCPVACPHGALAPRCLEKFCVKWEGLNLNISGDLPTPWARREKETPSPWEEDWGRGSSSGGRVEGSHQRQRVGMRLDGEGASNYLSGVSILRFHGDVWHIRTGNPEKRVCRTWNGLSHTLLSPSYVLQQHLAVPLA